MSAYGTANPQAKLSPAAVLDMRAKYRRKGRGRWKDAPGESIAQLAKRHGVAYYTAWCAVHRQTWPEGAMQDLFDGTSEPESGYDRPVERFRDDPPKDTASRALDEISGILTGGKWIKSRDRLPDVGKVVHVRGPHVPGGKALAKLAPGPYGLDWKASEWRGTCPAEEWYELTDEPQMALRLPR